LIVVLLFLAKDPEYLGVTTNKQPSTPKILPGQSGGILALKVMV
jgi:hypothetical protein